MPSVESISAKWPNLAKQILKIFRPEENDVIAIFGAHTKGKAGAEAGAWTLITQL